jgi:type I restriction enzyme R subunit
MLPEADRTICKRRIDSRLIRAGSCIRRFRLEASVARYVRGAAEEVRTVGGLADYVVGADSGGMRVIEAKRVTLGPQGIGAERYSKGASRWYRR